MFELLKPILAGQVRHVATAAGGALLAHGLVDQSGAQQISAALIIAAGAAWSAITNYLKARAAKPAQPAPLSVLSK